MPYWRKPKVRWRAESIDEVFRELPQFLTFRQVLGLLQVSERTLWRMISSGELEATHCRGVVKIPKVALVEYLQERNFLNWEDAERLKEENRRELRLSMGIPTKETLDRFCQTLPLWRAVVLKGKG